MLALHDGPPGDARLIGGKARGVAELLALGLPVPPALVLTADAHARWREQGRVAEEDERALAAAVERLGAPLAVRSSAADEDTGDRSAAGQYESVMGVRGLDAALAAIERCWRAADGGRAGAHRGAAPARVALVLQREVAADRAGVTFSADPVTGAAGAVLIEAVFGHGEGAVGGTVAPDRYRVDRESGAVAARVADKAAAADGAGAHGREVRHRLDAYLLRFGGRSRLHELSEPRDAERPALVLQSLRLLLERPRDLPAERAERAHRRERLERDVLARLEEPDRAAFADVVARVCAAVPLEETHAYHIDYPGLAATREALLGFGRRLVAEGRLDFPAHVFLLRLAELRAAVAGAWGDPLAALAEQRAAELREACERGPEPWLGTAPDPDAAVPPMVAKFYGVPGSAAWDGDMLQGTPASPGRAAGTARVIAGPADFARLESGDVLVCATTTPAWTPLFASAGALVTDTGGILSHAAIVAREYGLPAVVGCDVATSTIRDGARVEVDGDAGQVRVRPRR